MEEYLLPASSAVGRQPVLLFKRRSFSTILMLFSLHMKTAINHNNPAASQFGYAQPCIYILYPSFSIWFISVLFNDKTIDLTFTIYFYLYIYFLPFRPVFYLLLRSGHRYITTNISFKILKQTGSKSGRTA